jgi:transcriptional antiterminator Rof (Rho-off)
MDLQKLPYRAIACGTYDLFEAASLRKHPVRLRMGDGTERTGLVTDVFARGNEEFCLFIPENEKTAIELRLDAIAEIMDLHDGTRLSTGTC